MSPDELRAAADDVDNWTDPTGNAHVVAGAARRLAAVVEYTERQMGPPATDWEHDPAKILQTIARIARGENFPDFSERG